MNGTQTLGRAIDILFVLAESRTSLTVSEIAEKVSIPESTAYRFIQTLIKNGFVERKGRGSIQRLNEDNKDFIIEALQAAAVQISQKMGAAM